MGQFCFKRCSIKSTKRENFLCFRRKSLALNENYLIENLTDKTESGPSAKKNRANISRNKFSMAQTSICFCSLLPLHVKLLTLNLKRIKFLKANN